MKLLKTARELARYTLLAVDHEVGGAAFFYFNADTGMIRYLAVPAGETTAACYVLISPVAIGGLDEAARVIFIELTSDQILHSPQVGTDKLLTRRREQAYYRYYNWTPYWVHERVGVPEPGIDEVRLYTTRQMEGYTVSARDGEIGNVVGFVIDTRYWMIRYLDIDTRSWWPGKRVLIHPDWIDTADSRRRILSVRMSRVAIRKSPSYDPTRSISRQYESRLFRHYGYPAYWLTTEGSAASAWTSSRQ